MSEIRCLEALRELELYLDGELGEPLAARLVHHLGTCEPCLDHAEFQRRLREVVRTKCRSESPAHLAHRIRDAIRSERLR